MTELLWNKIRRQRAIKNTIIWGAFNTGFGVMPVLILWGLRKLPLKQVSIVYLNAAYIKLVDDGAINFFFLAIIGAATIDLILAREKFSISYLLSLVGLGFLAIVLIVFMYMAFLLGGDENHTFGQIRGIFWGTAIFTIIFCGHVKYNLTLKELDKPKGVKP
ncbi:MAG: hypothetical protein ACTHMD_15890 [Flavisolibacter sp.]